MALQTETFQIKTVMGELTQWGDDLAFLTAEELYRFNRIGHTGKDPKTSRPSSYLVFLNGLHKGNFTVLQTKTDKGDYREEFTIIRVTHQKRLGYIAK